MAIRIIAASCLAAALTALGTGSEAQVTAAEILNRVRAAEAAVTDIRADMRITEADKRNVSEMGKGYGDILSLQRGVMYFKKPDLMRMDGFAKNIKVIYIQNGYKKLVIAAMVRKTDDVKNAPGKRWDTLDLGFLSSRLWTDNNVSVASTARDGTVRLKFAPKFGDKDKRHDMVWIDPKTLRVLSREKYRGSGEMRARYFYSGFQTLAGKLPIATESKLYAPDGGFLGTIKYSNVKANTGLKDSLFSLSTK